VLLAGRTAVAAFRLLEPAAAAAAAAAVPAVPCWLEVQSGHAKLLLLLFPASWKLWQLLESWQLH
jgi:hypothetical protein